MTTFMKIEVVTYLILRVLNYVLGFVGAFAVLGFTGACEWGDITCTQYIIYEFQAFCLIALAFVVYYIREYIKEDFIRRDRILRRRAKRAVAIQN